jgi:hypothetical protein
MMIDPIEALARKLFKTLQRIAFTETNEGTEQAIKNTLREFAIDELIAAGQKMRDAQSEMGMEITKNAWDAALAKFNEAGK